MGLFDIFKKEYTEDETYRFDDFGEFTTLINRFYTGEWVESVGYPGLEIPNCKIKTFSNITKSKCKGMMVSSNTVSQTYELIGLDVFFNIIYFEFETKDELKSHYKEITRFQDENTPKTTFNTNFISDNVHIIFSLYSEDANGRGRILKHFRKDLDMATKALKFK